MRLIIAARIYEGQSRGVDGESNALSFEELLPYTALSKTYTHDGQVADSAPTATAMVRALGGSEEAVEYSLNPLPKQLGQKYKGLSPKVRQAILELPAKESAERLLAGLSLTIKVEDKYYGVLPEEVEVHAAAKEGYSVATEGPYLAALVTTISQDLFYEGLSREFVRRVQDQRKSIGLDIADRIKIYYQATAALSEAVKHNEAYIAAETLALAVLDETLPHGLVQANDAFDGEELHFALQSVRGVSE